MNTFWVFVGIVATVAVIMDGIVKIIRSAKSKPAAVDLKQLELLEGDVADLAKDLEDARSRIEVLEKIVIDDRFHLAKQIDGLDDLAKQA